MRGRPSPGGRSSLLTLAGEDVPGEARAVDEGRQRADGYVAYHRTFADVRLGGSHLRTLRAETQLHPTPAAAKLAHRFVTTPAGRKVFARALLGGIGDEAAIAPWNVDVRALPNAGHGFAGVVVTFELPEGRLEAAAIFMRSGRVIEAVTGICRAEDFRPGRLAPARREARTRLADGV